MENTILLRGSSRLDGKYIRSTPEGLCWVGRCGKEAQVVVSRGNSLYAYCDKHGDQWLEKHYVHLKARFVDEPSDTVAQALDHKYDEDLYADYDPKAGF